MSAFDTAALDELYALISAPQGVSVAELHSSLEDLFARDRSREDLDAYRLSKRPWKKLADEVTPVSRFLRLHNIRSGRIRFPLDDSPPDAWLSEAGGPEPVGIEVTIAQGAERFHLARELTTKGIGRGFIGLPDDAPRTAFDSALSRQRVMYTSGSALSVIKEGILRCLARKDRCRFLGFTLLVQAPLRSLPYERWYSIKSDLQAAAATLPFREVHVISNADAAPWGFQIKG